MHKPDQVELQLDRPQLLYSETLGPITAGGSPARYRRKQPNPAKKGPHIKLATPLGSWEADRGEGKEKQHPSQTMPPKSRTTRNMSAVPSQAESRPTTPHQEQLNQTEGANRTGADPQPQVRAPVDNVNTFVEVLQ